MSVDLAGAGASTHVAGRGARAAAGAASSGVSAQDLIATRTDTTTAAQGAGLLEDIESISSSLKEGSWLGVGRIHGRRCGGRGLGRDEPGLRRLGVVGRGLPHRALRTAQGVDWISWLVMPIRFGRMRRRGRILLRRWVARPIPWSRTCLVVVPE